MIWLSVILLSLASFFPPPAWGAISFVGSTANSSSPTSDTVVDLTAISGLAHGDWVVLTSGVGASGGSGLSMTLTSAVGWTRVIKSATAGIFSDDTNECNMGMWVKQMGVTPDASVTVTGSSFATSTSLAVVAMAFRGVDTPLDVPATTATGIDTFVANPPSISHNNPSGVWTVIAGAAGHNLGGAGTFTFPTGYTTNAVNRGHDDTNDITVGVGYRSSGVSSPEDPGTMTHSGSDSANFAWCAATLALRPQVTIIRQDTGPTAACTSCVCELPPSVAAGDLLVVGMAADTNITSATWPGSWAELTDANQGDVAMTVGRLIASGGETSVTITAAGTADNVVCHAYRIPNGSWHGTTAPEANSATATSTQTPDGGTSLDPSGWGTETTTWLIFLGISGAAFPSTYPTNYAVWGHYTSDAGGSVGMASSWRSVSAGSEDPGAWGMDIVNSFVNTLVAVRPAAVSGIIGSPVNRQPLNPRVNGGLVR